MLVPWRFPFLNGSIPFWIRLHSLVGLHMTKIAHFVCPDNTLFSISPYSNSSQTRELENSIQVSVVILFVCTPDQHVINDGLASLDTFERHVHGFFKYLLS